MRTTLVALLSFCIAALVHAQATQTTAGTVHVGVPDVGEPPNAPRTVDHHNGTPPRISFVHGYSSDDWLRAGLDDRISVHIDEFSTLLARANGDCGQVVLFIDGMPVKGLKPESCDSINGHVRFRLLRTPESDDVWHSLLGSPHSYLRPVRVTVGSDTQNTVANQGELHLEVIPRRQFFAFLTLLAAMVALFVVLCRRTSLIRSGSPTVAPSKRPYSLSLFQMAFWFFLVLASYVFLWLINDELDTITESVLALIGIGAATALGATVIDSNKAVGPAPDKSEGFLRDVLSDSTGVSLHRFQMFAWTIVLGVIFIASVYHNLEMPQFSATLLGLMGVSSGTYLGFKVPEKTPTDAPAGTAAGAVASNAPPNP
jgi:hypothetical protein